MSTRPVTAASRSFAALWGARDFADIQLGDSATIEKVISVKAIQDFALLSGDFNPLHVDEAFAGKTPFRRPVAHGMLLGSYLSTLIGMHLPGPGALWTEQTVRWLLPVFPGDVVQMTLRVVHKSTAARVLRLQMEACNQDGKKVMEGAGLVTMPKLEV